MTERPLQAGDDVVAPDVVGLSLADGCRVAGEAGVTLAQPDPDGPPLGALTWPGEYVITGQGLQPGTSMKLWDSLVVSWRKVGPTTPDDPAGVREPRHPLRPNGSLTAEAPLPNPEATLEVTSAGDPQPSGVAHADHDGIRGKRDAGAVRDFEHRDRRDG